MTFHTIYYGNCLNILKQLEKDSIHLIVTSPPYYNARNYSKYKTYQDYLDFMDKVISLLSHVLIEGGYMCLNSTSYTENKVLYPIPFDLLNLCKKYGFELIWDVIWLKPKYTQALWRSSDYNYKNPYPFNFYLNCFHEYIWICRLGDKKREISKKSLEESRIIGKQVNIKGKIKDQKILKYSYREWEMEVATPRKEGHTAAFPIELPVSCIEQFSVKNDLILDPFLGTGTTSRAAMLLGRNSIGIELNKEYFSLIKNKLIPKQRDMYQFLNEADLKKKRIVKNYIEFKNVDFLKETQFEVFTKMN
ncbi:MAG: DNA-methyltransferase [Candidatus Thorarchaeota archaeon]